MPPPSLPFSTPPLVLRVGLEGQGERQEKRSRPNEIIKKQFVGNARRQEEAFCDVLRQEIICVVCCFGKGSRGKVKNGGIVYMAVDI